MKTCKCGREIKGSYQDTCEDCWAEAQPFWPIGEPTDQPEFNGRFELLVVEAVAA